MQTPTPPDAVPNATGSSWPALARFATWLLLSLLASIALAWLSLKVQWAGLAPLVLFSLIVGGVLGGVVVALCRLIGAGQRAWILAASLLLALVTAGMQHVFAYQAYLAGFHESVSNNPKAALAKTFNPDFGPAGFWGYMQAEGRKRGYWLMWSVDAVLIVLAATAVVWWGMRRPYCTICRRWYHVGRVGALPGSSAAATCSSIGIALPVDTTSARFRLLECQRGCSPAQLEVLYTTPSGGGREAVLLNITQRAQLEAAVNPRAISVPTISETPPSVP